MCRQTIIIHRAVYIVRSMRQFSESPIIIKQCGRLYISTLAAVPSPSKDFLVLCRYRRSKFPLRDSVHRILRKVIDLYSSHSLSSIQSWQIISSDMCRRLHQNLYTYLRILLATLNEGHHKHVEVVFPPTMHTA